MLYWMGGWIVVLEVGWFGFRVGGLGGREGVVCVCGVSIAKKISVLPFSSSLFRRVASPYILRRLRWPTSSNEVR